jgi:hypothetical protein
MLSPQLLSGPLVNGDRLLFWATQPLARLNTVNGQTFVAPALLPVLALLKKNTLAQAG